MLGQQCCIKPLMDNRSIQKISRTDNELTSVVITGIFGDRSYNSGDNFSQRA